MRYLTMLITISVLLAFVSTKTKEEWKSRTIYQILTDRFYKDGKGNCDVFQYCGGTYDGITKNLDYIAGMGFDAIWISPIVENTEGSYHGYHLTNLYKLNTNFGDETSLKRMISECHKRNIWVMVDVVGNHVGPVGTNYSRITPFNRAEHYHDVCQITDYNNQWMVENCRLADLPDLKQENDWVTQKLVEWIEKIVQDYNFDGIRIDTLPEVPKWFWDKFTAASGVFQIGEVFNGNPDYVSDYQRHCNSVFNYPLYYSIEHAFRNNNMRELETYWFNARNKFPEPQVLGLFIENHDNPRFLNRINDRKKFKNAVALSFTWEGIPVFYYGGEQWFGGGQDPYNREALWNNMDTKAEIYQMIETMNKMRIKKEIWKYDLVQRYSDEKFYAFTRGEVLVCLISNGSPTRTITYHDYSDGTKLCNIFNTSDCVTVKNGKIDINMNEDPKIYVKM